MEEKITFTTGTLNLEGLYKKASSDKGAVILHPHPLYGGDMNNPVVESLAQSFNKKNYTTLRVNFRGVGGSEGSYDEGNGEQEDVLAAIRYLTEQGITSIYLAGYSYGSWVLGKMKEMPKEVCGQIFIAPPLALLPFEPGINLPLLKLVITGEEDEIAPPDLIKESLAGWNREARFEIIDFADHFYFGSFKALEKLVENFLSS